MSGLSNIFSVLNMDAEDDKEEVAPLAAAKNGAGAAKSDKNNGKGKTSGKQSTLIKNESNLENPKSSSSSGEYRLPLVWIDLEMTGLNVEVDRILEIACVITDGNLNKLVEGPDLVIGQTKECLDNMGEWCREHHAASGLTKRVLQSTITEHDAEKQVIDFVKKYVDSDSPLLAGNSIYVDFMFLKKYMPELAGLFPHVLVDVSSVMALCVRWFPKDKRKAPKKENKHRAMDDIKESIKELKFYKDNIFKAPNRSRH
ncbi:oligoribonuclease [Dioscorea cayenensis subsp. rotundata]|uniref:Oligoribonuclease n=1 Tax=Dioscorea cayennensis subsp. rotundata TaxID=55577 RepID=A0AB40AXW1_DIOCR|nr:oligoribonuclease [Dioscorea cayenensis subsp. rotundata]